MDQTYNQPLLSVIVPCYNVEKYINKCISSIVDQTYSNLEIILIDDGSTDNTVKICDERQDKDQRIRVIHKQNEGVAYARKTGVENATAEYVTFVDADDWIDVNMYADMMSALLTTNSDIVHCGVCEVYEDGSRKETFIFNDVATMQTYQRIEAVTMLLKDKWWQSVCSRIYKKNLFDHIEIPKGRIFGEDQLDYRLFHYASQTVFLNHPYYFYFQRSDSISRQGNMPTEMKKMRDLSDLYYERFSFVKQHPEYYDALPHAKCMALCFGIFTLDNIIAHPQYASKEYFDDKIKQIRSLYLSKEDYYLWRSLKIKWRLLKISPKLYKFLTSLKICIIRLTNRLKITNRPTNFTALFVYDLIFTRIKLFC